MPHTGPALSTALLDAAVELIGRSGYLGSVDVAGVSMHPTFRDVQRLAVEFSPKTIGYGDVLVFRQREILVVHRLVQRTSKDGKRRFRTRGDGTNVFDLWLDPELIIGRVVAVGYAGGRWRTLRTLRGRLYAKMLGLHDLCWGGLGAALLKVLGSAGPAWHWRLGRIDLFKLNVVHALLFRLMHPSIAAPEFDGAPQGGSSAAEARCYTRLSGPSERKNPNQP